MVKSGAPYRELEPSFAKRHKCLLTSVYIHSMTKTKLVLAALITALTVPLTGCLPAQIVHFPECNGPLACG